MALCAGHLRASLARLSRLFAVLASCARRRCLTIAGPDEQGYPEVRLHAALEDDARVYGLRLKQPLGVAPTSSHPLRARSRVCKRPWPPSVTSSTRLTSKQKNRTQSCIRVRTSDAVTTASIDPEVGSSAALQKPNRSFSVSFSLSCSSPSRSCFFSCNSCWIACLACSFTTSVKARR